MRISIHLKQGRCFLNLRHSSDELHEGRRGARGKVLGDALMPGTASIICHPPRWGEDLDREQGEPSSLYLWLPVSLPRPTAQRLFRYKVLGRAEDWALAGLCARNHPPLRHQAPFFITLALFSNVSFSGDQY